jgi:parvulin-like peptidyl-prolyl cis-trans isomerase-like protein
MRNPRLALVFVLILAGFRYGTAQTAPVPQTPPVPQPEPMRPAAVPQERAEGSALPPTASSVAPTAAVITIHGFCPAAQATGAKDSRADCKTVVTRAEFEKLADSLQPNMPPQLRQQLANRYPQIVYMAAEARKQGLENDPHYLALLKFTKMELLGMELQRSLEEQAGRVSNAEVQNYYKKNPQDFEQASIERIYIPKIRQTDTPKPGSTPEEVQKSREDSIAAMAKVADDLHARAAAGENFDKLQKEAYDAAGMKATVPPTLGPKVHRNNLPTTQSSVFDMKPGELSQVINDPQGFFIYRMQSKTTPSFADVKDEIRNTLRDERLKAAQSKMQGSVSADLNKDYFGESEQAAPAGSGIRPSNRPRPTPPVVQPQQ